MTRTVDAPGCMLRRGFLGWMHNVRGTPLEKLSLRAAVPTAERDGVALAFEYIQWLLSERQISVRTEGLVIRSIMAAAKHLHHDKSQVMQLSCLCTHCGKLFPLAKVGRSEAPLVGIAGAFQPTVRLFMTFACTGTSCASMR